jgi:hypothetical protein
MLPEVSGSRASIRCVELWPGRRRRSCGRDVDGIVRRGHGRILYSSRRVPLSRRERGRSTARGFGHPDRRLVVSSGERRDATPSARTQRSLEIISGFGESNGWTARIGSGWGWAFMSDRRISERHRCEGPIERGRTYRRSAAERPLASPHRIGDRRDLRCEPAKSGARRGWPYGGGAPGGVSRTRLAGSML